MQALAIIDMQRWMFRLPEREAQLPAIVPVINRLAAAFAQARKPVFQVEVVHRADRSSWSRLMLKYDYPCMIEGTTDVEPVDGLALPQAATTLAKHSNSAFLRTDFEERLRTAGIDRLVLAGAFLDGCVGLTAADAAQRGLDVILVDDAIAHRDPRHRAFMVEWLASMYELRTATADEVCG